MHLSRWSYQGIVETALGDSSHGLDEWVELTDTCVWHFQHGLSSKGVYNVRGLRGMHPLSVQKIMAAEENGSQTITTGLTV